MSSQFKQLIDNNLPVTKSKYKNSVQVSLEGIDKTNAKLTEYVEVLDDALQKDDTLNSLLTITETDEEPLSSSSVKILHMTLESIYEDLGMQDRKLTQYQISTEGVAGSIKSGLSKIWQAIKIVFQKVFGKLVQIYKYATDVTVRIESRTKNMIDKINRSDKNINRAESFKNSKIAKGFTINNTCNGNSVITILSNHGNLTESTEDYSVYINEFLKDVSSLLSEYVKTSKEHIENKEKFLSFWRNSNSVYSKKIDSFSNSFRSKSNVKLNNFASLAKKKNISEISSASSELFNSRVMLGIKKVIDEKEQLYAIEWTIEESEDDSNTYDAQDIDVLQTNEMLSLCNAVLSLNTSTKKSLEKSKLLEKASKELDKFIAATERININVNKVNGMNKLENDVKNKNDKINKSQDKEVKSFEAFSMEDEEKKKEEKYNAVNNGAENINTIMKIEAKKIQSMIKSAANIFGQLPRGNIAAMQTALDYIDYSLTAPRE